MNIINISKKDVDTTWIQDFIKKMDITFINPNEEQRLEIGQLTFFKEQPSKDEIKKRTERIAEIAAQISDTTDGPTLQVYVQIPAFMCCTLERELIEQGLAPVYPFLGVIDTNSKPIKFGLTGLIFV